MQLITNQFLYSQNKFLVSLNKRITVSLDEKLIANLRKVQAEIIHKEARSVSLSEVMGTVLEKGLKK